VRDSARVFAEVVTIGDGLTSLADGLPVCHMSALSCRDKRQVERMSPEECCGRYCSLPTAQVQGAHVGCQPKS
jgi:hypothetical protein